MRRLLLAVLLLSSFCYLKGQNITNEIIATQIERMTDRNDEEADYSEEMENYLHILDNKININDTDELSQLSELNIINITTVEKVNEYRKKYGDIIHINELKYIEGIDEITFQLLKNFVVFKRDESCKPYSGRHYNTSASLFI